MKQEPRIDKLQLGPLENNVWIIGDDEKVLVIDAAHDAQTISQAIGERKLQAVLITHGHFDHINAAVELQSLYPDTPIYIHPDDEFLWEQQHPDQKPNGYMQSGMKFQISGTMITALHTPGHTPGSISYYVAGLQAVFTGDTLFPGGPGATRWDYSDFDLIVESIKDKLFTLPEETKVHPGHGQETDIGTEKPELDNWIERGW